MISQNFHKNSQENTCSKVSFLIKSATLWKKRLWHKFFPVNVCKIVNNNSFTEHLRTTSYKSSLNFQMIEKEMSLLF